MRMAVILVIIMSFFAVSSVIAQEPVNEADSEHYGADGTVVEAVSSDEGGDMRRNDWDNWDDVETFEDMKKNDDLDF